MSWLRRNRWALVLLIPAIALAVIANSYRFVNFYLPWFSDRTIDAEGTVSLPSGQFSVLYPGEEAYEAHLTPRSVEEVDSAPEVSTEFPAQITPAPGGALWRVTVDVEADPLMMMYGCELSVEDSGGNVYSPAAAKLRDGLPHLDTLGGSCIPLHNPGPGMTLMNEYEPPLPGEERPPTYEVDLLVAVPHGVEPVTLRVSAPLAPAHRVDLSPLL